jgi:prophage regulatory protein
MQAENFLRRPAVQAKTGKTTSELYDDIAKGTFPKPVKIGERAVAWRESEVAQWQKARIAARDGGEAA